MGLPQPMEKLNVCAQDLAGPRILPVPGSCWSGSCTKPMYLPPQCLVAAAELWDGGSLKAQAGCMEAQAAAARPLWKPRPGKHPVPGLFSCFGLFCCLRGRGRGLSSSLQRCTTQRATSNRKKNAVLSADSAPRVHALAAAHWHSSAPPALRNHMQLCQEEKKSLFSSDFTSLLFSLSQTSEANP